ncbi:MAG: hypothetical protein M0P15_04325 [Bacteroides sp.]|nr:hypothetical protein [Bacteroides sp.]
MTVQEAIQDSDFKKDLELGIEVYKGLKDAKECELNKNINTLLERGDLNADFIIKEALLVLDDLSKEDEAIQSVISFFALGALEHIFNI